MKREFTLSPEIEASIDKALSELGTSLSDSKRLAQCALDLSDYFIQFPDKSTPWNEKWAQMAYLSYFLPLNLQRNRAAAEEGLKKKFFDGLENVIDFGAGPATASLALNQIFNEKNFDLIETSSIPPHLVKRHFKPFRFHSSFDKKLVSNPAKTLAVFSYSLTEIKMIPSWALECEALMILEPSTQEDGRKLQELRGKLIKAGYSMWAPCTHQKDCPLLVNSKRDWCHDRIFFTAPPWFTALEENLPIKNKTLTYSYLLARRKKPDHDAGVGRLVGDQLNEKGKVRQMFCRNENREFLAWLTRKGEAPPHYRGELFKLPENHKEVSNELRLTTTE